MKEYPKKYEDFYFEENKESHLKINEVSTDIGLDGEEYAELLKKELFNNEIKIFDAVVRYYWLISRFRYKGYKREYAWRNGRGIDSAYGLFMRYYANCNKEIFAQRDFFKLSKYFLDFFPHFHVYNPFENPEKYKYPYKNIGLSYLMAVYQMEDRLELLDMAERTKMVFPKFLNYILNHGFCINEELGYEKYAIGSTSDEIIYLKNKDISQKEKQKLI